MANLLESYKNRLAISESIHQKSHSGAKMSNHKRLLIASVLNNTSRFMNEAFDNSAATQRSALGDYKRFCLNVATTALPNLILPDLMLTQPMTSITGYVTYLKYSSGIKKGDLKQGEMFNSAYRYGKMTPERIDYTSDRVTEEITVGADGKIAFAWTPVNHDIPVKVHNGVGWVIVDQDVDEETGEKLGTYTAPEGAKRVAYAYDNVVIPQEVTPNSLATLTASMEHIQLHAHARRIAIYYSQIAAFQAKTDYGFDLADQLSAQAQGELAYEIDSEGVALLDSGAELCGEICFKSYDKVLEEGLVSVAIARSAYYEQFSEILARAKKVIFNRTQKFAPNYMVCGTDLMPILPYLKGWNAAPASQVNGPYFAGTVDGLKVYVSPSIQANRYFFGVNGSDLQTSAAVYAPYMAIVPTQLLGFADGGMSQGFSTMYDMKLLSTYNGSWEKGTAEDAPDGEIGKYSYLLVAGEFTDVAKA